MKSRWTKQELDMAERLAQELQEEEQFDLDKKQSLKDSLMSRIEHVDADRVIEELQAGIDMFHMSFEAVQKDGMEAVAEKTLDEMLKECKDEEQEEFLFDILSACAQAADRQVPDGLEEKKDLSVLKKAVIEYLCEYSVLYLDCETSFKLTEKLGEENIQKLVDAEETFEKEIYMALAVYILKVQGRLENVPAQMTEREIGISVAAAGYKEKTIWEGIAGRLDWKEVEKQLKLIAGTAILALLTVVTVKVAAAGTLLIAGFVHAVVGIGMVGILVGFMMGIGAAGCFVKKMLQVGEKIGEWTGVNEKGKEVAEQFKIWFYESLKPALEEFWKNVAEIAASWTSKDQRENETSDDVSVNQWETEEEDKQSMQNEEEDTEEQNEEQMGTVTA